MATQATDLRCPRCGAHAPSGAQWCSLCFTDLQVPATDPEPAPEVPTEAATPSTVEEPAQEASSPDVRPRGKHARRAHAPAQDPAADAEAQAAQLLAQLAASESGAPLGRYSGFVDTPAKKVGLMVGGAVVAMLALFVLMAVVGSVL